MPSKIALFSPVAIMLIPTDPPQTQDTPPPTNDAPDALHQYEQRQQQFLHSPNLPGMWPMQQPQTPTGVQYMPYHNMSTPPQQTMMGTHYGGISMDYSQAGPKRLRFGEEDRYSMASGMDPGQVLVQVTSKYDELAGMMQQMSLKMDNFEGKLNEHKEEITHIKAATAQSVEGGDRSKSQPKLQVSN